jgi:hypothetical protein
MLFDGPSGWLRAASPIDDLSTEFRAKKNGEFA